jgi:hypothetical protein
MAMVRFWVLSQGVPLRHVALLRVFGNLSIQRFGVLEAPTSLVGACEP